MVVNGSLAGPEIHFELRYYFLHLYISIYTYGTYTCTKIAYTYWLLGNDGVLGLFCTHCLG